MLCVCAAVGALSLARPALAEGVDPMTIGAIEILSGPNAKYGVSIKQGFDLGVAAANRAGGVQGRPLAIAYEDSAGSKEQAINAARQLLGRTRCRFFSAPPYRPRCSRSAPIAVERKTPIIGTSTTANGITAIGPYVFRTSLPEADVIPVTLRAARDKFGVKKVAVLYGRDDAFTKSAYDVMAKALADLNIEVLTTETFGAKDTDFSAQLTKIKSLNPDAIVVSALADAGAGILLGKQALGFPASVRVIGGNGLNSPKVLEIAGAAADGLLVGSPWFVGKSDPLKREIHRRLPRRLWRRSRSVRGAGLRHGADRRERPQRRQGSHRRFDPRGFAEDEDRRRHGRILVHGGPRSGGDLGRARARSRERQVRYFEIAPALGVLFKSLVSTGALMVSGRETAVPLRAERFAQRTQWKRATGERPEGPSRTTRESTTRPEHILRDAISRAGSEKVCALFRPHPALHCWN